MQSRPTTRRAILRHGLWLAGGLPVLGLAACAPPGAVGGTGFNGPLGTSGATGFAGGSLPAVTVAMTDRLRFEPQVVTVRRGQTVAWRNVSRVIHTVTFDPNLARRQGDVVLPPGVEPFTTGNISPGQTVSYRFTVPGQYRYFCIPHELQNMTGGINVVV